MGSHCSRSAFSKCLLSLIGFALILALTFASFSGIRYDHSAKFSEAEGHQLFFSRRFFKMLSKYALTVPLEAKTRAETRATCSACGDIIKNRKKLKKHIAAHWIEEFPVLEGFALRFCLSRCFFSETS
jgi:hypothetical protein